MTSFQLKIAGQTRNQDTMTRDQEKQKRSETSDPRIIRQYLETQYVYILKIKKQYPECGTGKQKYGKYRSKVKRYREQTDNI